MIERQPPWRRPRRGVFAGRESLRAAEADDLVQIDLHVHARTVGGWRVRPADSPHGRVVELAVGKLIGPRQARAGVVASFTLSEALARKLGWLRAWPW